MFEPLGAFAQQLCSKVKRDQLVFANIPPQAIIFTDNPFVIVDVKKLREAWGM